jgi:hypothetical protein
MPIASIMDPGSDGFATVMEPPDRQGHGATPRGGREADRQPHGATRSPGSWSHFVRLAGVAEHDDREPRHGPMSLGELKVIDVKEVLRRRTAGQSARQMPRDGVVIGRTATRYIEAVTAIGLGPSAELTDEADCPPPGPTTVSSNSLRSSGRTPATATMAAA